MEDQKIIEELDSLWWFSNVFSSSKHEVSIDSEAVYVTEDVDEKMMMTESCFMEEEDPIRSDEEKKPIPESEILSETEQAQSSYTDSEVDETSSEFGSLSESDFEYESEPELHGMMRASVNFKEEERNNRRIKEFSGSQKYFSELGFDFGDIGLDLLLVPMIPRLPRSGNPYLVSKMPPLSDGMAMKKHLKLWAHAVACNVR